MPDFSYESQFNSKKLIIAGCDEAGRGCLAGPVSGASVIIKNPELLPDDLNDSKKLSEKKRNEIYKQLLDIELDWSQSFVDEKIIDKINILEASYLCINNSINNLKNKPNHVLVDGNRFKSDYPFTTIIKGDSKSLSIATASIFAKVLRDKFMIEIADPKYPEYGFAKHKGYATKSHYEALKKHGHCDLHRITFLKKFYTSQLNIFH